MRSRALRPLSDASIASRKPVGIGRAGGRLALQFLPDEPGIDQLVAQILGQGARVALIAHHVRGDQHQQLGARPRIRLAREQGAEQRDILQDRESLIALRVVVADQAGHPDRLAVLNRNAGAKQALIESRRVDVAGGRSNRRR